ncbi:MAG: hypothetical protein D6714_08270 [Bacteroidetes bacterium]|nr:MAG: hypothetical protein D6714_08270 [Bacteroidota bacterium]
MKLSEQIEIINQKVARLSDRIKALESANAALSDENKQLKKELTSHQAKVGELTSRLTKTQRALEQQRDEGPAHSQKLREQIDQYIKDIDQVIEWLQNS